jgi:hypothetical protein
MLRPVGTEFEVIYHSAAASSERPHTIVVRWKVASHVMDAGGTWDETLEPVSVIRSDAPPPNLNPEDREIK